MKLKAIKQICMNAGRIIIYSTPGGRQWIGTNEVCFLADESVKLTQDAIITIFELDDKKLEKVKINEMPLSESGMLPLHGWSEEAIMGNTWPYWKKTAGDTRCWKARITGCTSWMKNLSTEQ